jgi:oligopeptide/dipeptide ABC transporter ATP-binding protein
MSQPGSAPLLSVENLRTVFTLADGQDAAAVDEVSFAIAAGETLGLVGESGSGKSVTALSLVRLVRPPGRIVSGRVELDGRDLMTLPEASMRAIRGRRIGFVFQEPMVALDPVYTIGAQIVETLRVHGLARGSGAWARATTLLERVHIPDAARRVREYPHQLSGGLRQRAMIALALSAEPDLLIADEPTTALDVTVQAEILDLLRDLRGAFNLSILLITHDLGVIAEMADRVAVMYGGRIVEEGSVGDVLTTPAHPYTQALLASLAQSAPGSRPRAIPGNVPGLGRLPAGCAFSPRCPNRFEPCGRMPELTAVSPKHIARCFLYPGAGQ